MVTLIFPSKEALIEFQGIAKAQFLLTNYKNLTIKCECTEAEIELAIHAYNAQIAEHGNVFKYGK